MNSKKNILVTGGAGYIGSSLAWSLDTKFNIIILDDLSCGKKTNISDKWKFYKISILNKKILKKIFSENKISIVIHAAAKISVSESEEKKKLYNDVNYIGTKNLILEAKKHKSVEHFIFSSSAAVYGNPKYLPINEKHPKKPINFYGKTKLKSENFILNQKKQFKKISILRYFNVSGIANNYKSGISNIKNPNIISKICIFLKQKKKIKIFYENSNSIKFPERDFIHIKDIIRIYKYLIFKDKKKLNIINCCSSKKISLLTIINLIEKKLTKKINYKLKQLPKNECLKIFGKKPKILLKTQSHTSLINSTVNWHFKIR